MQTGSFLDLNLGLSGQFPTMKIITQQTDRPVKNIGKGMHPIVETTFHKTAIVWPPTSYL